MFQVIKLVIDNNKRKYLNPHIVFLYDLSSTQKCRVWDYPVHYNPYYRYYNMFLDNIFKWLIIGIK